MNAFIDLINTLFHVAWAVIIGLAHIIWYIIIFIPKILIQLAHSISAIIS